MDNMRLLAIYIFSFPPIFLFLSWLKTCDPEQVHTQFTINHPYLAITIICIEVLCWIANPPDQPDLSIYNITSDEIDIIKQLRSK